MSAQPKVTIPRVESWLTSNDSTRGIVTLGCALIEPPSRRAGTPCLPVSKRDCQAVWGAVQPDVASDAGERCPGGAGAPAGVRPLTRAGRNDPGPALGPRRDRGPSPT